MHFIITLRLTWQYNKSPWWERSSRYLQICTLVPFTICWYRIRQEPFLIIPAKKNQWLYIPQQKSTEVVNHSPSLAPADREDKQGSNCKVTAYTCTVHLLLVKEKKLQWKIQFKKVVFDASFLYKGFGFVFFFFLNMPFFGMKRIEYFPSLFSAYTDVSFSSTSLPVTQTRKTQRSTTLYTRKKTIRT